MVQNVYTVQVECYVSHQKQDWGNLIEKKQSCLYHIILLKVRHRSSMLGRLN